MTLVDHTRFVIAAVLICLVSPLATAAEKTTTARADRHEVVRLMAQDLQRGLSQSAAPQTQNSFADRVKQSAWELKQWWEAGSAPPQKRKIAIWPFWQEESVVSEDFAEMLSDSLLAALLQEKDPRDEYVAREDLKIVTKDIDDFNSLRQSSEKIGALIRSAGADILIVGEVKPESDGQTVYVRYRATNVSTGAIPATTDWYKLEYDFDRTPTMGIADAVKRSAAHFRIRLAPIRTIRPQGIRFADSGIQTPFGRWFASRLIAELSKMRGSDGQTINVADAVITDEKTQTRGLELARKTADLAMTADPTGDYVLSGRYWLLGEKVDLQLTLQDGRGTKTTWQGDVRTSSIDLPVLPEDTLQGERETDRLGPISLFIRSNRGANPVYRTGQKMVLFVEASRDSYLYCFYRQADGSIMRVFPNRHHRDARIPGGAAQHIPGAAMPFDWIVAPPTGVEIMKCFAFDRDVGDELPRLVRKLDFEPLPYGSLADLSQELRTIRRAAVAENSMIVNVEK